jgi:nicotinate-nucleotide adenylyltransferase
VDTLADLRRRHPANEFFLLIGSDTLADLPQWREPIRILQQAGLVVMVRPNHPPVPVEQLRTMLHLPDEVPLRYEVVQTPPLIDISSRDLRRRAAAGRSLRYLMPRAVECYVREKQLYREGKG